MFERAAVAWWSASRGTSINEIDATEYKVLYIFNLSVRNNLKQMTSPDVNLLVHWPCHWGRFIGNKSRLNIVHKAWKKMRLGIGELIGEGNSRTRAIPVDLDLPVNDLQNYKLHCNQERESHVLWILTFKLQESMISMPPLYFTVGCALAGKGSRITERD
jgi:hypothetical protein